MNESAPKVLKNETEGLDKPGEKIKKLEEKITVNLAAIVKNKHQSKRREQASEKTSDLIEEKIGLAKLLGNGEAVKKDEELLNKFKAIMMERLKSNGGEGEDKAEEKLKTELTSLADEIKAEPKPVENPAPVETPKPKAEKKLSPEVLANQELLGRSFVDFIKKSNNEFPRGYLMEILKKAFPEATIELVYRNAGAVEGNYFTDKKEGNPHPYWRITIAGVDYLTPKALKKDKFTGFEGFKLENKGGSDITPENLKRCLPAILQKVGERWEIEVEGLLSDVEKTGKKERPAESPTPVDSPGTKETTPSNDPLDKIYKELGGKERIQYQGRNMYTGEEVVARIKDLVKESEPYDPRKKLLAYIGFISGFENKELRSALSEALIKADPQLNMEQRKMDRERAIKELNVEETIKNHLDILKKFSSQEKKEKYLNEIMEEAVKIIEERPEYYTALEKALIENGYLKPVTVDNLQEPKEEPKEGEQPINAQKPETKREEVRITLPPKPSSKEKRSEQEIAKPEEKTEKPEIIKSEKEKKKEELKKSIEKAKKIIEENQEKEKAILKRLAEIRGKSKENKTKSIHELQGELYKLTQKLKNTSWINFPKRREIKKEQARLEAEIRQADLEKKRTEKKEVSDSGLAPEQIRDLTFEKLADLNQTQLEFVIKLSRRTVSGVGMLVSSDLSEDFIKRLSDCFPGQASLFEKAKTAFEAYSDEKRAEERKDLVETAQREWQRLAKLARLKI